ncbi:unnamed protein product [Cylindrotheca closterium]|uniref:Thiol oxidase n=1 Tax=Cylindrotheca closterium TaxID=2856 RepID=A0AAD2FKV7_9STRA|nr:unnamed protein product [Cylindrotheca closterium]
MTSSSTMMTRTIGILLAMAILTSIAQGGTTFMLTHDESLSSPHLQSSSHYEFRADASNSFHLRRQRRRRLEEEEEEEVNHNNQEDEEEYDDALGNNNNNNNNAGEITDELQAGAHKAKLQFKSIDRHSEQRAIQLKEHLAQNSKDKFAREQALLLDNNASAAAAAAGGSHEHDQLTSKMKIHIPGTKEFIARQKALMDKVKSFSLPKKQGDEDKTPIVPIQHVDDEETANGNNNDKTKKKAGKILPFLAKHLPKPPANILRRTVAKIPFLRMLHKPLSLEEEMILDASVSFFVHLETMVYDETGKLETEEQMVALSNWLDLVSLTLPPEWHLHKLIDDLQKNFSYIAEGADNLHEILAKHKLRHKQWSHECTIDRGKFHVGFDCGFWKLLHIVSLGVAEQKGGIHLVQAEMVSERTKTFSPLEAANVIRNLIKFYYNPDYSSAFVQDYDDCNKHRRCDRLTNDKEAASVGDWKELPLWLWEVHNDVAINVLKETTQKKHPEILELTQEEEMKVIWPSVDQCHLCFQEDGTWNENQVFNFLEEHYWIGTDVDPKYDRLLRFQGEEEDATLFTVYGLVAVFLVILYILVRLVLGKSHTIQIAVRRARNYANFKQSKARTV